MMKFDHFYWKDSPPRKPGVLAVQGGKFEFDPRIFYANILICTLLFLYSWFISNNQDYNDYQSLILGILPGGEAPEINEKLTRLLTVQK